MLCPALKGMVDPEGFEPSHQRWALPQPLRERVYLRASVTSGSIFYATIRSPANKRVTRGCLCLLAALRDRLTPLAPARMVSGTASATKHILRSLGVGIPARNLT